MSCLFECRIYKNTDNEFNEHDDDDDDVWNCQKKIYTEPETHTHTLESNKVSKYIYIYECMKRVEPKRAMYHNSKCKQLHLLFYIDRTNSRSFWCVINCWFFWWICWFKLFFFPLCIFVLRYWCCCSLLDAFSIFCCVSAFWCIWTQFQSRSYSTNTSRVCTVKRSRAYSRNTMCRCANIMIIKILKQKAKDVHHRHPKCFFFLLETQLEKLWRNRKSNILTFAARCVVRGNFGRAEPQHFHRIRKKRILCFVFVSWFFFLLRKNVEPELIFWLSMFI